MGAADASPVIGLTSGSTDTDLALKMFSGEVLATFLEKNVFLSRTMSKNVGAGSSHQFPVLGSGSADYHVAGEDILDDANGYLNSFQQAERVINVDKTLISAFMTDDWDERIRHFEIRAEYAKQCGAELADRLDKNIAQTIALAARSTANLSTQGSSGGTAPFKDGTQVTVANSSTSAAAMVDAMIDAATVFAENEVPMDDLTIAIRPDMFFLLQEEGSLLDQDFGNAGNGSRAYGKILKGYGFNIVWSNHIPTGTIAARTGENNTYSGTFTQTAALAFGRKAVGTVYRDGIAVESDRIVQRQGDLVVARMRCGTGILRPEMAVEILDSAL